MRSGTLGLVVAVVLCLMAPTARAGPPDWLRELAAAPLPPQPPEVGAVKLLDEVTLKVAPDGSMRRHVRRAFRVLRQGGEKLAEVPVVTNSWNRVRDMRGWTIPASGKPFEARLKDSVEGALAGVAYSSLVSDVRARVLLIPAAHPGATVGYEIDTDERGPLLADLFSFQDDIPVLLARYSLELPPDWNMTHTWSHFIPVAPVRERPQTWQWTLRDLAAVKSEPFMPSWRNVAGILYVAFAPSGAAPELASWQGIGAWHARLARDRRELSPGLRDKVAELVRGRTTVLDKLQALAAFVQGDIRYVAINLGIGGYQPHPVADVFANRFGDCKDKATLLGAMLAAAGIDSVPVLVNTDREAVAPDTPPGLWFDHMILAVRLPQEVPGDGLLSLSEVPGTGRLLFFDPTDEVTPLGRLPGELQGGFGLLANGEAAGLVQLPGVAPDDNSVRRTGRLRLDAFGELSGDVIESFRGESARTQREGLRGVVREADAIRPLQARLAGSLAQFRIDSAVVDNREALQLPLQWRFSLHAAAYATRSGNLLVVRPRVLGLVSVDLTDQKETRVHALSFARVHADEDEFTIELPAGYVPESLPAPVDLDFGFAAYRSHAEMQGGALHFARRYELRQVEIPAARFEDYRKLQGAIARDERAVAMFRAPGP